MSKKTHLVYRVLPSCSLGLQKKCMLHTLFKFPIFRDAWRLEMEVLREHNPSFPKNLTHPNSVLLSGYI